MRRHQHAGPLLTVAVVSTAVATLGAQTSPQDYAQWRGATRDGSASAFAEPTRWPETLAMRWRVDVGEGYGTPIVVGNRVYTLGITGIVSCFSAADGALLWQKPAPPNETLYNNSAMSPIVDDGAVIFHVGGHDKGALTKFDAVTGAVKWAWAGDGPAYASPLILDLGGVRQVVAMTQRNIVDIAADTGTLLWQRPWANQFANHSVSPVAYKDTIIMSGYEMGVVAIRPVSQGNRWTTDTVWETKEVSMFMSNPVLVGNTLTDCPNATAVSSSPWIRGAAGCYGSAGAAKPPTRPSSRPATRCSC